MLSKNFDIIWKKIQVMSDSFLESLPAIIIGIFVLTIFFIVGKVARHGIRKLLLHHRHYNLILVLGRMVEWLFIILGLLITLSIIFPSITPADLLAGIGLSGLALALAFKDILKNYLAGVLILLQQPFKIGDEIKYKEFEGKVDFIDTRTTFLKSYDGKRILIPNGEIYTNAIIVNTTYGKRCTEYVVGIAINEDIEKATKILLECLTSTSGVLTDPQPEVLIIDLNRDTNNLLARWWTTPKQIDILRIQSIVLKKIKIAFDKAHIVTPYPTQVVLLGEEKTDTESSVQ